MRTFKFSNFHLSKQQRHLKLQSQQTIHNNTKDEPGRNSEKTITEHYKSTHNNKYEPTREKPQ